MKKKINEENLNHSESTVNNDLKRRVFSLFSVLFDCFFVFTFFWLRLQGSQNESKFLKTISACLLDCSKHYRNCYLFLSFFLFFFRSLTSFYLNPPVKFCAIVVSIFFLAIFFAVSYLLLIYVLQLLYCLVFYKFLEEIVHIILLSFKGKP